MGCTHTFPGSWQVITRPLCNLWSVVALGEVLKDWREARVPPVFRKGKKDTGNYELVSLIFIPGKVVEQLILETTSRHVK